ncbi:restriction endonuclease [Paenibacillus terrae]|uniref:Restriction endonuclease type IV Mrr domain-containing protein n=1 Tax=Paenibacillus terrae TaxID=159743 RepID=A0A0D7WV22_9BACL|nr:restriction endonuclease [Paenibacillus terrae]KJD43020.1 hypothetical protein QD47_24980 [Paenibacillus terrae]
MLKRKRKSQQSLSMSSRGVLCICIMITSYLLTKSVTISIIITAVFLSIVIAAISLRRVQKSHRLLQAGMHNVDLLDGKEFEMFLRLLFEKHGYRSFVTKASGDFGADLVLEKGESRIIVQAKRYQGKVGLKAVQEVVAAVNHYKGSEGWVVTNSSFTEQTYTLAKSNNVRLIDREGLLKLILQVKRRGGLKIKHSN